MSSQQFKGFDELRILLVDDDPTVLKALKRRLSQLDTNANVFLAEGGKKAIETAIDHNFDLIVTDLRMPDTDGAQVLQAVRKQNPASMRVMLSGQASTRKLLQALPLSHQYIEKPCPSQSFIQILNTIRQIKDSRLPATLIKHLLTLARFPVDALLVHRLQEEVLAGKTLKDLNLIITADLGLFMAAVRLARIVAGAEIKSGQKSILLNLTDSIGSELLNSSLLAPVYEDTSLLRAIRLISIKTNVLASQLKQKTQRFSISDYMLIAGCCYIGELAIVTSFGTDPYLLSKLYSIRHEVSLTLVNLWNISDEVTEIIKDEKIRKLVEKIDAIFPVEEFEEFTDEEIISILGEVVCLTDL